MKTLIKTSLLVSLAGVSVNAQALTWDDIKKFFRDAQEFYEVASDASRVGYTGSAGAQPFKKPTHGAGKYGELKVATLNIKGFPTKLAGISDDKAKQFVRDYVKNHDYDIAGIQENWVRNDAIMAELGSDGSYYPYRSDHYQGSNISYGDGLTTLSIHPFKHRQKHIRYNSCEGNYVDLFSNSGVSPDCETEKGFTFTEIHVNRDLVVHFYNTHMDTTGGTVKQSQYDQLETYIKTHSQNYPVIVLGDFNDYFDKNWNDSTTAGNRFASNLGLTWSCAAVASTDTNRSTRCDYVDHLAFRGNSQFDFSVTAEKSIDQPISDHDPLITTLKWTNKNYQGIKLHGSQTSQSSIGHGGDSWRGTDGIIETNFGTQIGVHTQWQANPWWEADVSLASIDNIDIFHRTDWGRQHMTDFWVMVSEEPMTGRSLSNLLADRKIFKQHYKGHGSSTAHISTEGVSGNFVRIQSSQAYSALMFAEIEFYGNAYGNGLDPRTVSLKPVLPESGRLHKLSVGDDGRVWGTNKELNIYHHSQDNWHHVDGKLVHVAVGDEHNVWGIGQGDAIWKYRAFHGWERVAGTLRQLDVGYAGEVWGVSAAGAIFRYQNGHGWQHVAGELQQISVGDANNICGITFNSDVYCRSGFNGPWVYDNRVRLRQISVGRYGRKIGIGATDNKVYVNMGNSGQEGWVVNESLGEDLIYVDFGTVNDIWAIDNEGKIHSSRASRF